MQCQFPARLNEVASIFFVLTGLQCIYGRSKNISTKPKIERVTQAFKISCGKNGLTVHYKKQDLL